MEAGRFRLNPRAENLRRLIESIVEMLAHGRFLYVDDLVTLDAERSKGHGDALIDWLEAEARREGCRNLQLDSGTQRTAAHRFYFRKRMVVNSFHFWMALD